MSTEQPMKHDGTLKKAFRDWWTRFDPKAVGKAVHFAKLRRCSTPADALGEQAARALLGEFGLFKSRLTRSEERRATQILTAAIILANVREDEPQRPFARRLGDPSKGAAPLSPLRFQRLLNAAPGESQIAQFRRAVMIADRRANVGDLGAALYYWGDRERVRWIYQYHQAAPPPSAAQPSDSPETVRVDEETDR